MGFENNNSLAVLEAGVNMVDLGSEGKSTYIYIYIYVYIYGSSEGYLTWGPTDNPCIYLYSYGSSCFLFFVRKTPWGIDSDNGYAFK